MPETIAIIWLALGALAIGTLLPVLFQMRRTLRVAERRVERVGRRVEDVLDDTHRVVRRIEHLSEGLEEVGPPAARLIESMSDLTHTLAEVREKLSTVAAVSSAVGPAVVAAVRAWRAPPEDLVATGEPPPPTEGDGYAH